MLLFIVIQLGLVIFNTIKSILTLTSKPLTASIVNAFYYMIYYYVVKLIGDTDLWVVMVVAFGTNFIGVFIGKKLIEIFRKDRLWVYEATIKCKSYSIEKLHDYLKCRQISSVYTEIIPDKLYTIKIFSESKETSKMIEEQLCTYKAKYHVIETK